MMDQNETGPTPQPGHSQSTSSLNQNFERLATNSRSEINLALESESQQTVVGTGLSPSKKALFQEFLEFQSMKAAQKNNPSTTKKRPREEMDQPESNTAKRGRPNIPAHHQLSYKSARNAASSHAKYHVLDNQLKKYIRHEGHLVPKSMQVNTCPNILFTAKIEHNQIDFLDQTLYF